MWKNIVIIVLSVVVIGETLMLISSKQNAPVQNENPVVKTATSSTTQRTPPAILTKGDKLTDSPISKFSYQVYPGSLSDSAKTALVGWNIKTQTLNNGLVQISLTPKDADDQSQQYTLKPDQKLYFVEMTKADDSTNPEQDKNLRDDYGIITNQEGIVQ